MLQSAEYDPFKVKDVLQIFGYAQVKRHTPQPLNVQLAIMLWKGILAAGTCKSL